MNESTTADAVTADPDEGKQTIYRTFAYYDTASPMGLLPACWKVTHYCTTCHDRVGPDQLIAHARQHDKEVAEED
jgi:hypothetical protein